MSARAVILVGNKVDLVRSRLVSTEGTEFFLSLTRIIDVRPRDIVCSDGLRGHARIEIRMYIKQTRSLSIIEVAI